jgi:hypothetical protein
VPSTTGGHDRAGQRRGGHRVVQPRRHVGHAELDRGVAVVRAAGPSTAGRGRRCTPSPSASAGGHPSPRPPPAGAAGPSGASGARSARGTRRTPCRARRERASSPSTPAGREGRGAPRCTPARGPPPAAPPRARASQDRLRLGQRPVLRADLLVHGARGELVPRGRG